MTEITVRPETIDDRTSIATLIARTYLAEGAHTIELASKLRNLQNHQADLSLVGEIDGQAVAFTMFTPVKIGKTADAALLAAPMARDVRRDDVDFIDFLAQAMAVVKEQGQRYILLFGEKDMFESLGFVPAADLNIKDTIKPIGAELLAKDLTPTAKGGVQGAVEYPDVLQ